MTKVYLVAEAMTNNNVSKKGMRIFSSLENVVDYVFDIATKNDYSLWYYHPTIGYWMFKAYEFDMDKDVKAKVITKDIAKHFTIGDVK